MIQRIQSLYLMVVLLLCLVFFRGSLLNFTDESGKVTNLMLNGNLTDQTGLSFTQVENIWPITVILILIITLSIITILFYKNRKTQLLLAISVIIIAVCLVVALSWYALTLINTFKLSITPGYKMAVPVLILIFSILAYRGILKDDRLIKSYDRLR